MGQISDWEAVYKEAQALFCDLLRFDTTNPPGNELEAAKYIQAFLKKEGYEVTFLESGEGRANLVARLKGDGSKKPLLLHGHLDVVAVEPEKWTHPPFAAEIHDGFIWGRGTVDMKNFVAQAAMTLALLKREKETLKRDVIFCALADEENGMNFGSKWMAKNHPDLVKAEYAIGEGGGFQMSVAGKKVFTIMIGEKGVCWLRLKATGTPGHGSIPHNDMASVKIARAAAKLGDNRLPLHVTPASRSMIEALASLQPKALGMVLRQVMQPLLSNLVLDKLMPDKNQAAALSALIHNTVSPTVIRSGEKTNVIPGEASLELDGRVLPGFTKEEFIKEIEGLIGDGFEIETIAYGEPVQEAFDDPFVDTVKEVMADAVPGCSVIPFVLPGYTDAKNFANLGVKTYGFAPLLLPDDLPYNTLAHGHDERISVEGFNFGVKTLHELVLRFCG